MALLPHTASPLGEAARGGMRRPTRPLSRPLCDEPRRLQVASVRHGSADFRREFLRKPSETDCNAQAAISGALGGLLFAIDLVTPSSTIPLSRERVSRTGQSHSDQCPATSAGARVQRPASKRQRKASRDTP